MMLSKQHTARLFLAGILLASYLFTAFHQLNMEVLHTLLHTFEEVRIEQQHHRYHTHDISHTHAVLDLIDRTEDQNTDDAPVQAPSETKKINEIAPCETACGMVEVYHQSIFADILRRPSSVVPEVLSPPPQNV